MTYIERSKFYY